MVAPNWNPGAPGKKGIELRDVGVAQTVIDSPNAQAWLRFIAQSSHPVTDVEAYLGTGANSVLAGLRYNNVRRPVMLELVAKGDEPMGDVMQDDFNVSSITGGVGMVNENWSTPITTSRLAASNDGLFLAASSLGAAFNANFGTAAYPLDRHVIGIVVNMRINLSTELHRIDPVGYPNSPWFRTIPWWTQGAQPVTVTWGEVMVEGSDTAFKHWTPQMIREFATTRGIRCRCMAGPGQWRMDRLYISVLSVPERRVGVGLGAPQTSLDWMNFDMVEPDGAGSPAIVASDEYTLLARRTIDGSLDEVAVATMPWRVLRGRSPSGDTDDWGRFGGQGDFREGILAARMLNGATYQAETQGYMLNRGAGVFASQEASQTLTLPGDGTIYGQVYVMAGWNPTDGRPAGPLRAEVYRVADGVRVFSPVELTADDVDALPVVSPFSNTDDLGRRFKQAKFRFPESEPLSAGQYELRFSSPDSTELRPWAVSAMIGEWASRAQSFGGTTDAAEGFVLSGGVPRALTSTDDWHSDLQALLVEVPAAVTGTGSSIGSLTAHHLEVCDPLVGCDGGCGDASMPYIQLTWSPAPTGTPAVVGYDVDRFSRRLQVWQRVAYVDGRESDAWNDLEAVIGFEQRYRVRVVREDNVTGDWSDEITETIPTGQVALAFSCNAATGMGCVYPEVWEGNEADRQWGFAEADDVSYGRMYGRNRSVAFRPLERAGDVWERDLLVSALCSVPLPSMTVFDPLRDLAWSPVPYVCVRDGEGNRWFISLEVPEGNSRRAGPDGHEVWTVHVRAVDVSDTPAVHDTSVPQITGPVRL